MNRVLIFMTMLSCLTCSCKTRRKSTKHSLASNSGARKGLQLANEERYLLAYHSAEFTGGKLNGPPIFSPLPVEPIKEPKYSGSTLTSIDGTTISDKEGILDGGYYQVAMNTEGSIVIGNKLDSPTVTKELDQRHLIRKDKIPAFLGTIEVDKDGKLIAISNNSGVFQEDTKQGLKNFLAALQHKGLTTTDDIKVFRYDYTSKLKKFEPLSNLRVDQFELLYKDLEQLRERLSTAAPELRDEVNTKVSKVANRISAILADTETRKVETRLVNEFEKLYREAVQEIFPLLGIHEDSAKRQAALKTLLRGYDKKLKSSTATDHDYNMSLVHTALYNSQRTFDLTREACPTRSSIGTDAYSLNMIKAYNPAPTDGIYREEKIVAADKASRPELDEAFINRYRVDKKVFVNEDGFDKLSESKTSAHIRNAMGVTLAPFEREMISIPRESRLEKELDNDPEDYKKPKRRRRGAAKGGIVSAYPGELATPRSAESTDYDSDSSIEDSHPRRGRNKRVHTDPIPPSNPRPGVKEIDGPIGSGTMTGKTGPLKGHGTSKKAGLRSLIHALP